MKNVKKTAYTLFLLGAFALPALVYTTPVMAEVLQSQMGTNGETEVDIIKAKVDGNVMTIVAVFRNMTDGEVTRSFKHNDVYYIVKKENKKYMGLIDGKRAWLAAPVLDYRRHEIYFKIPPKAKKLIWMKFPAPPADVNTIDFVMPVALPFDKLPVQR